MLVKRELDFEDLKDMVWSGAVDTVKEIEKQGKEDELMSFLEMYFCDEIPTETELNDLLWFEDTTIIFPALDITEYYQD